MPFLSARFNGIPRLEEVAKNQPVMKYGEISPAVAVIQQALIDYNIPLPISTKKTGLPDGIYKSETRSAVKEFQRSTPFPIADDGIVGENTMAKLDNIFKAKPTPKPTKPTASPSIVLPENMHDRREEIIRRLMKDAGLTRKKAEEVSKALLAVNVARHGVMLAGIIGVINATGALAAGAAALGPLTWVIGSLIALTNAMESGIRISGNLGYAYGMTAWAFNKPRPGFSTTLRKAIMGWKSASKIGLHEDAWKKGVNRAFQDAPLGRSKLRVDGKSVDMDTYKLVLRLFGDDMPGRFSYNFSFEIAKQISDAIERNALIDSVKAGCQYNL